METRIVETTGTTLRISVHDEGGIERGRAFLFIMQDDLHDTPFGLVENLTVQEAYRKQGIGTLLMKRLIEVARERNCYKLIATSRKEREFLHKWYEKLGFTPWGVEFRLELHEPKRFTYE